MTVLTRFPSLVLLLLYSASAQTTPYLWQTNVRDNNIYIYNLENFQLVHRLEVGANPHGITTTEDKRVLYVSLERRDRPEGEILWINPDDLEIKRRLTVCKQPHNISTTPDGKWLYVPCHGGDYWVVDTESGKTVKKITTGGRPHNTRNSRDGRYMYLSPLGSPKGVTVVDVAANHEVTGFIPFGGSVRPLSLSEDGALLFQQVDGVNGFRVADTKQHRVLNTVEHSASLGWTRPFKLKANRLSKSAGFKKLFKVSYCHGLEVRPDQKEVWSACGNNLTIHDLNRRDYPETAHLNVEGTGYWLTFSPDSRFAALAVSDRDQVAIIDTADKKIIRLLQAGREPKRNIIIDY